jgi:hypothetical protein
MVAGKDGSDWRSAMSDGGIWRWREVGMMGDVV